MVIFLGLAAAVLYGSGDFLGGMATRKLPVLPVLLLADTAGLIVALVVAAMSPGPIALAGLAWGISAGLIGGVGLIIFYIGLATGPMSVSRRSPGWYPPFCRSRRRWPGASGQESASTRARCSAWSRSS